MMDERDIHIIDFCLKKYKKFKEMFNSYYIY